MAHRWFALGVARPNASVMSNSSGNILLGSSQSKQCTSCATICLNLKRKTKVFRWVDIQQVRKTRRQVFFTKLNMQNIEEFRFVSIVKRGHMLLSNFWPTFLIKFLKNKKIAKNKKNPKKYVFNIFVSFLTFSTSSQNNLNFQRS